MNFDLEDWHSRHLPVWEKLFQDFKGKDNVKSIEIGACEGRSALWMLDNILTGKGSTLVCIDPFSTTGAESSDIELSTVERTYRNFTQNVLSNHDNVALCRGYSDQELRKLTGLFDTIYVDGSHVAKDVLTDIVLSWLLLKSGGLLLMDDYEWATPVDFRDHPKYAIDAFLEMFRNEYYLLHKGIQVAVRKK